MIKLKVDNKQSLINNFLSPISKLTENAVIKVRNNEITSLSTSNDGTLIVNCTVPQTNEIEETIFLNVPDINKFIKVLGCISDEHVDILYNNNNLEYKSPNVGFKYHLLDDGIIDPPSVNIEKIKKIDFPFKFKMDTQVVSQLIKASTFTTDTNKIYFYTTDDTVTATLTDRQRHNVDSYSQQVASKYTGSGLVKELALSFETMRIISTIRFNELTVHINPDLNVFLFQIEMDNSNIMIVSSGFVG